jgi:tetratricopeptide (TPR) repeat protein
MNILRLPILLSDHGFHPDHLRPASIPDIPAGPAIEHRDFGVLAISGPGIVKCSSLHGPSILDVAPTILTLYGLPVGEDMDGKVLSQAFVDRPQVSHIETYEIFSQLHPADPDEQRFAVGLFVSCQALGMHDEMRRIVADLARRTQTPLVNFLKAQVLIAEKRYLEALAALDQLKEAHLVRPALFLQTADLYLRLRRWRDAQQVYEKALALDPDNAQAHIGLCRMALRRRKFDAAAHAALGALERVHHDPAAHFLLGPSLTGMKDYRRAQDAFSTAISLNPNFPEAHIRIAALLEKHLGDAESAREHRRLARRMRRRGRSHTIAQPPAETVESVFTPPEILGSPTTPIEESVIVTGLPRSGTSMLMQMLAAGGMDVVSDGLRVADEDNPRCYLEFEPVKNLLKDSKWLFEARGRVVKIVAPLLAALPPGLACRVMLCERDLEEVLDSQDRMLRRRNRLASTPERRRMLKDEYARMLGRAKAMLTRSACTELLMIEHRAAISDPLVTAERLNRFLGGGLDIGKMVAAIDPTLHRNQAIIVQGRQT